MDVRNAHGRVLRLVDSNLEQPRLGVLDTFGDCSDRISRCHTADCSSGPALFHLHGEIRRLAIPRLLAGLMLIVIGPALYYGFLQPVDSQFRRNRARRSSVSPRPMPNGQPAGWTGSSSRTILSSRRSKRSTLTSADTIGRPSTTSNSPRVHREIRYGDDRPGGGDLRGFHFRGLAVASFAKSQRYPAIISSPGGGRFCGFRSGW